MGSPKKLEVPIFMKQESLYNNLTLDELIKNVMIPLEKPHVIQNPSSSSSSSSALVHGNLNQTKKIMDDHIVRNEEKVGDFTLDEFLIRSGAIKEGFVDHNSMALMMPNVDQSMARNWRPVEEIVGSNFQVSESTRMMNLGYLEKQLKPPTECVAKCSDSQKMSVYRDERITKSVERRQRRMIKNRESAARSRARKQAYINQLQHSVVELKTTNNLLRNRKEVITLLNSNPICGPRVELRRSSSAHF